MIFVDTSAWFAGVVAEDINHAAAAHWLEQNVEPLLTTDYIIDEVLTLLRARGQPAAALMLGQQFFAGTIATVHYLTEAELLEAWHVFETFFDKTWSFTDCTSKVLMGRLHIDHAFAFDRHFAQFAGLSALP
jgi:predicted nucleic acid-binding protein